MKKYVSIMMSFLLLLLIGCTSESESVLQKIKETETPKGLVENYLDKNIFIDVDVNAIVQNSINPTSRSFSEDDMAKMKAAIFRFYKNVSVEDGYYVCSISNASDINVSQEVYMALLNNLQDLNNLIKQAQDNGDILNIQIPDSAYFESLLR